MIVVTGALGFIGSALLGELQQRGYGELVAVDNFSDTHKFPNLDGKNLHLKIDRSEFLNWLSTDNYYDGAHNERNRANLNTLNNSMC